jgi:hypothetical protein
MNASIPRLAAAGLAFIVLTARAQQDLEPAVQTSPASTVAPRPAPPASRARTATAAPAATAALPGAASPTAASPKGGKSSDRIELDTTQISGNRELPRVMYVVPWRRPDPGEFAGRPPNSLLDEALTPVDRDVFKRQNRYYSELVGEPASPKSQPGAAGPAAARPTAKDEK